MSDPIDEWFLDEILKGPDWRRAVIERMGSFCVAWEETPGCDGRLECHHVIYRSKGGKNHVENGLMLCQRHHGRVHARSTLLRARWLTPESRRFLAYQHFVDWDDDGDPFGTGLRGFAPLREDDRTAMVSTRWLPPQRRN